MKRLLGAVKAFVMSKFSVIPRQQPDRATTRFTYCDGPMYYLGQQIVKRMEEMGYPSKIYTHFRSPALQAQKKEQGFSRARPWESPHQYGEAVDIASAIHPAWPPKDDPYWRALKAAKEAVEAEFGVDLTGGFDWGWDLAHIETNDWRAQIYVRERRKPSQIEQDIRFKKMLPKQWKQFAKSRAGFQHVARYGASA